jgi:hypothetical protein
MVLRSISVSTDGVLPFAIPPPEAALKLVLRSPIAALLLTVLRTTDSGPLLEIPPPKALVVPPVPA